MNSPKYYIINLQTHHVQYTDDPFEADEFCGDVNYIVIDTCRNISSFGDTVSDATPVSGE